MCTVKMVGNAATMTSAPSFKIILQKYIVVFTLLKRRELYYSCWIMVHLIVLDAHAQHSPCLLSFPYASPFPIVLLSRAVANGPVGPAMAGPIIGACNFYFYFIFYYYYFLLNFFSGQTNNRASHFEFRIFFNTESP